MLRVVGMMAEKVYIFDDSTVRRREGASPGITLSIRTDESKKTNKNLGQAGRGDRSISLVFLMMSIAVTAYE